VASVSNDGDGRRRLLFVGANGKRKAVRLGKVSTRQAEAVKVKIEQLVSASMLGQSPDDETARCLSRANQVGWIR